MQKNMKKVLIALAALIAAAVVFVIVYNVMGPKTQEEARRVPWKSWMIQGK